MERDEKTGFSFMNQPGLINIDVTGLCNKTCNYCPRSQGYPNQKEYMNWKDYALITFGCSFTYGHGLPDCIGGPDGHAGPTPSEQAWPAMLGKIINMNKK